LVHVRSATDRPSLADEQAAVHREASLRRIATLVAGGVTAGELFSAVAGEVSVVLDVPVVTVGRYELEGDSPVSVVLASREHASFPVGSRWPLDGAGTRDVYEDRRPIRIEDFSGLDGTLARAARQVGMSWVVGAPITVDGAVWGNIYAGTAGDEPIPEDAESRLADFTDLVSTAIANSDAREKVQGLAEEQAALRRVATLVARGVRPLEVFSAVSEEVGRVFASPYAGVARFEPDGSGVVILGVSEGIRNIPIGTKWPFEEFLATTAVYRTGRPARNESRDWEDISSPVAEKLRELGLVSTVAAPIVVEGTVWGVITVSDANQHLPPDAEERLAAFTELVATAIANAESRGELASSEARARELASEQAALRRVATLVAEGASADELLALVSREVGWLLGADATIARFGPDGSDVVIVGLTEGVNAVSIGLRVVLEDYLIGTTVYRTGSPARTTYDKRAIERFVSQYGDRVASRTAADAPREINFICSVAAPIVVAGDVWGLIAVDGLNRELPPDTEERLVNFTELVATAIANAESRGELAASEARARELAEEQVALRRVATLVAQGASPDELFAGVAKEVAGVIGVPVVGLHRYGTDAMFTVLGMAGDTNFTVGSRCPVKDEGIAGMILATGRPARKYDYSGMPGPRGASVRADKPVALVGVPIVVDGSIWGFLVAAGRPGDALPADTEVRLARFTELVATAIANSQAREHLAQLADEQTALRRVAALVAGGASSTAVFDAVAREVAELFQITPTLVARYEDDGAALTILAICGARPASFAPGSRWPLDGPTVAAEVLRTRHPVRLEDYTDLPGTLAAEAREHGWTKTAGAPIIVDGRVWGLVAASGPPDERLPESLEDRLAEFTQLVATAIANSQAHEELAQLVDEQAALRRVATLVAQGASPDTLFSAVAKEVAGIIDVPVVGIHRYEADGTVTTLGVSGESSLTVGTRLRVTDEGIAAMMLSTGRPSRIDDYTSVPADAVREDMRLPMVGVPIVVEGSIWGFMVAAAAKGGGPLPAGTEERLARFTELVATAVSNATTRTELLTSRARVVSAGDETRRRLERDLHDGIQQWLVALALRARKAAGLSAADESASQELSGLADDLVAVTDELREISRGIHPAILSDAGLDDALAALARRSAIRVDLDVSFEGRYDPTLEATVYYVAAESITNAVKHAQASTVTVRGGRRDGAIELEITDDGVGGADPRRGTGLIGLKDRVDTLGGTISFASPAGAGTTIRVKLPAGPREGEDPPLGQPGKAVSAPASG
jgi:signal transduction histidine kinase/uncharacterized protein YoaH (UPF0181 family)